MRRPNFIKLCVSPIDLLSFTLNSEGRTGDSNSQEEVGWIRASVSNTDWTKLLLWFCIMAFRLRKFALKNTDTFWNIRRALIIFNTLVKVPNKCKFCVSGSWLLKLSFSFKVSNSLRKTVRGRDTPILFWV